MVAQGSKHIFLDFDVKSLFAHRLATIEAYLIHTKVSWTDKQADDAGQTGNNSAVPVTIHDHGRGEGRDSLETARI